MRRTLLIVALLATGVYGFSEAVAHAEPIPLPEVAARTAITAELDATYVPLNLGEVSGEVSVGPCSGTEATASSSAWQYTIPYSAWRCHWSATEYFTEATQLWSGFWIEPITVEYEGTEIENAEDWSVSGYADARRTISPSTGEHVAVSVVTERESSSSEAPVPEALPPEAPPASECASPSCAVPLTPQIRPPPALHLPR